MTRVAPWFRRLTAGAASHCFAALVGCAESAGPVVAEVESVTITSSTAVALVVGETMALEAVARDPRGAALAEHPISWTSRDADIASVSATGVVTGMAPGATQIVARAGGRSASAAVTVSARPVAEVRIAPGDVQLEVGGTVQLAASAHDALGAILSDRPVAWSSTDERVAAVSSGGAVTAIAPGSATIRATAEGKAGTSSIAVTAVPVSAVDVSPSAVELVVGGEAHLAAMPKDRRGGPLGARHVTWTTDAPGIVEVSANGRVAARGEGTATVTAASEGKTGRATVTVRPAPVVVVTVAAVAVAPATATIQPGTTLALRATPTDARGNALEGRAVAWSSSDVAVASVSPAGVVTAVAPGSAAIVAASEGRAGTASITVTPVAVASVDVSPSSASVPAGSTIQLSATPRDASGGALSGRALAWASANPTIATVSQHGVVTGVGPGTVSVSVASEGTTGTAAITVTPVPVASLELAPAAIELHVGREAQLTATPRDASGAPLSGRRVAWSSDKPAVAGVSASGKVVGHAEGTATITGASEGKVATAMVTVRAAPVAAVAVTPEAASLVPGATVQLQARLTDPAGNVLSRPVTWTSANASVARVSATGLVTAIAPGSASITAASEGRTGSAAITVGAPPVASVAISPATAAVVVGSTVQLVATPRDAAGSVLSNREVAWTSSDRAVITVSPNGVVAGVAPGTGVVSATSEGRTASATVTVSPKPAPAKLPPQLVVDGNSLSTPDFAGAGNSWPQLIAPRLPGWTIRNFAVSGQTTPQMSADAARQIDALYDPAREHNILVVWELSNDLGQGATAEQADANMHNYCLQRRTSAHPWIVIVVSMLPRDDVAEAKRTWVNAAQRDLYRGCATDRADPAGDSRIGDQGDPRDRAYYVDSVHLNRNGNLIIADLIEAAIKRVTAR